MYPGNQYNQQYGAGYPPQQPQGYPPQQGGYPQQGYPPPATYGGNAGGFPSFPSADQGYSSAPYPPEPSYGGFPSAQPFPGAGGHGGGFPAPYPPQAQPYPPAPQSQPYPPPAQAQPYPDASRGGYMNMPGGYEGTRAPPSGPPPSASGGPRPPSGPPPGGMAQQARPQLHMTQTQYNGLQEYAQHIQQSDFHGKKKALLIGINYFGTKQALRGCINDVKNVKAMVMRNFGFREDDMVILTDDQTNNPQGMPTKANILRAMRWLVSGSKPGDSLFLHFSGHGSRTEDTSGDEIDGFDDTIIPVDFAKAGEIVDDDMNEIMVRPLPQGCRLTAFFDCCHSGSALDLPYMYDRYGNLKNNDVLKLAGKEAKSAVESYMSGNVEGALGSLLTGVKTFLKGDEVLQRAQKTKSSMGDVIMFSGCKDVQTSADANIQGQSTGALTHALCKSLNANSRQTYLQLLNNVRGIIEAGKYTQLPQLSTGRPMDMNSLFMM